MTLPSSGQISLAQIHTEFGGPAPYSLFNYYRGGSYVPNTSTNSKVPTSGAISLEDFYGASAAPATTSYTVTFGSIRAGYQGYTEVGYDLSWGIGSIHPTQYLNNSYVISAMAFSVIFSGYEEFLFQLSGFGTGSNSGWTTITAVDGSNKTWTFNRTSMTYTAGSGSTNQTWQASSGINPNFANGSSYIFTIT